MGERPKVQEQNWSQMSNQDKINAAAIMYGAGSAKHQGAIRRFGGSSR
ncbi:Uncharacterised protein [Mycobacteroides abscessus subsp. abscessus]|nr:hypothetical protein [Mycobacteroides abscessus]SHU28861.1 Uncharacterised protein [Mycobacteroides abscessus subsp. abscessus]